MRLEHLGSVRLWQEERDADREELFSEISKGFDEFMGEMYPKEEQ